MHYQHLLDNDTSFRAIWAWAKKLVNELNRSHDNGLAVGTVAFIADTATLPTDWLVCDGSVKNKSDYPALFLALGNTVGTTFTLPNLTSPLADTLTIIKA